MSKLEFVSVTTNRVPSDGLAVSTRNYQDRVDLPFALVIEEPGDFRSSVMALLRERGWFVHGVSRAEEAFSILVHIPYDLIVLDSELCQIDLSRLLENSGEWRALHVVVISRSTDPYLQSKAAECGAFLVERSNFGKEFSEFLQNKTESWQKKMLEPGR